MRGEGLRATSSSAAASSMASWRLSLLSLLALFAARSPTFCSASTVVVSTIYWNGGSGLWSNGSMWSQGRAPGPSDKVLVSLDYGEIITLRTNVTVKSLVLTSSDDLAGGGTLRLTSSGLTVTDTLLFARGTLSGSGEVVVRSKAYLSDYADKVLSSGASLVNYGNTSWDEGNLVLRSGGSIVNYGHFFLTSPASSIKFSEASFHFTSTTLRVMNKEVWLYDVMPQGSAIYDMWSSSAVLPSHQGTSHDLAVMLFDEGSRLYFERVPELGNSAHSSMYDDSLYNVSLEACAEACYDTYASWCASFDYAAVNQNCHLSRYKAFDVGNLTKDSIFSHYEMQSSATVPSTLGHFINYGKVQATATYTSFSVPFDNRGAVSLSSTSTVLLLYGGNFSSNSTTTIDSTSEVMLGGGGTLTWHGSLSGQGMLQVMSGSHRLPSTIAMPSGSFVVSNGATVTPANNMTTTSGGGSLSLTFDTVVVNGTVMAPSMDLHATTHIKLGSTGNLTADGLGFSGGTGPGAGRYGKQGGGGASYAGYGGNGMNTSAAAGSYYGSYYLTPGQWLKGSGGGGSAYGKGGAGGGRIRLWSKGFVQLEGSISAKGASGGQGAGGGGSGGSIVVNATTCSGDVTISADGGAGGYPYGWMSGGGGSGGRVALYCTSMGMATNISAIGGKQADQAKATSYTPAAAGTIYQRMGSNLVETLVVDNRGQGSGTALGATVLHESTNYYSKTKALSTLSVLRGARVHVTGSGVTVNVSSLVNDGSGSILVSGGGTLALPWSYTLLRANMTIKDGGRLGGVQSLVVGSNTLLTIDSTGYNSGGSSSVVGTYSLVKLQVTSGGVIKQTGGSVNLAVSGAIEILKNSTIYVTNTTLQASALSVYGTSRVSGLGKSPRLTVDSSSVVSFFGRATSVDAALFIINKGSLRVWPSSSLSLKNGASIYNYKTLVLSQAAVVKDGGGTWGVLANGKGAQVVMNGTLASLYLVVNNTGSITIPRQATLQMSGGYSAYGATLSINGTLSVVGGKRGGFRLLDGTGVTVLGNITLYNSTLYFPQTLPITTVAGSLICLDNGTAVVAAGGATPSYSFTRVWVRQGGTFKAQASNTKVATAVLEAGGTLSVSGGGEVVVTGELRWWGGTIKGNGVVETKNTTSIISSSTKYLLDRVKVNNRGTVNWARGVIVSHQASSFVNYKIFNISTGNSWATGGDSYYFQRNTNARYPLWPPIVSYQQKTVAQCATLCKAGGLSFAAPRPNLATYMTTVGCYSFNYNRMDGSCDLFMYSASGSGGGPVVSLTTTDNYYDYYELVANWTSPAAGLLNMPGATLKQASPANVTLAVNVTNRGTLSVPLGTLTLSGGGWMASSAVVSIGSSATLQIKGTTTTGGTSRAYDLGSSFDATACLGTLLFSSGSHVLCPTLSAPSLTLGLDASSTTVSSSSSSVALSVSRLRLTRGATLLFNGTGTATISAKKVDVASAAKLNVTGRLQGNFTQLSARTKGYVFFTSGTLTSSQNMSVTSGGQVSAKDGVIKAAYLYVSSSGRVHSDGLGSGSSRGAYGNFGGSGGSYGGKGGKGYSQANSNATYGSIFYPTSYGSQGGSSGSGGAGGLGGGRLVLNVTTALIYGTISAQGASGQVNGSAGGSGGSLLIFSSSSWAGSGNISAEGGSGATGVDGSYGGGGGGGRIALYVTGIDLWTGKTSAAGGSGYQAGGPGTIYYRGKGVGGTTVRSLLTISGGTSSPSYSGGGAASTVLSGVSVGSLLSQVTVTNKATLQLSGSNMTILSITGDGTGTVRVDNSSYLSLSSGFYLSSATLVLYQGVVWPSGNVTVGSGGVLKLYEKCRSAGRPYGTYYFPALRVQSQGTVSVRNTKSSVLVTPVSITTPLLFVQGGGTIEANAAGYLGGVHNSSLAKGPGRGNVGGPGGSGGGYGGQGGPGLSKSTSGGIPYGDVYWPREWGSGGGASGVANGGRGGGLVLINATSVYLYGTISANGANGSAPGGAGGSGGSILLQCLGLIRGNGQLSASGGDGAWTTKSYGGGGGGGRISLWYAVSNFTGSVDVRGGVSAYQATTSVDSGAVSKGDDWRSSFRSSTDQRAAGGTLSMQRAGNRLATVTYREVMAGNQRLSTYSSRGSLRGHLSDLSYNPFPSTPISTIETNSSYGTDVLYLGGGAVLALESFTVLNVTRVSAGKRGHLRVSEQSRLVVPNNFSIAGFTLDIRSGKLEGAGNLTVRGAGVLSLRRDGWTASAKAPGNYIFGTISLRTNASMVFQDGAQLGKKGITVSVGTLTVARGAKLHSNGRGYSGGTLGTDDAAGPCAGSYGERRGEGGGHAGAGGRDKYKAGYGSALTPLLSGSGGGASLVSAGGAGGGTIRLQVGKSMVVDGSISANGVDCPGKGGAGGAGGSVLISANGTLSGAGNITTVGGSGCAASSLGGAGAGGRVSIRYGTWAFTGLVTAKGGKQWDYNLDKPAAGTIYLERQYRTTSGGPLVPSLRVLKADSGGASTSLRTLISETSWLPLDWLNVTGGAAVELLSTNMSLRALAVPSSQATLTIGSGSTLNVSTGSLTISYLDISLNGTLSGAHNVSIGSSGKLILSDLGRTLPVIRHSGTVASGTVHYVSSLDVQSGGMLVLPVLTISGKSSSISLVSNVVNVRSGGKITADGYGYAGLPKRGSVGLSGSTGASSAGDVEGGAGGGHAGQGADGSNNANGGTYRGDALSPVGSGGGGGAGPLGAGGAGGGGIHLVVTKGLTLDGTLSANGKSAASGGAGGGGAGGSVWIEASGRFGGSGSISADGGDGDLGPSSSSYSRTFGGAGSGGRIKLSYTKTGGLYSFTGSVSAKGGVSKYEVPTDGDLYGNWDENIDSLHLSKMVRAPSGTAVYNTDLLTVNGGALTYSAPIYPTIVTRPKSSLGLTKISALNRASISVASGTTITNLTTLASDGSGSVTFPHGSTLSSTTAGVLAISGCSVKVAGNVSYLSRLTVANGSTLTLSSTLLTTTSTSSDTTATTGRLDLNDLRVYNKSVVTGSSVYIRAGSISLLGASSIHADSLGYSGGSPGQRDSAGTGAGGFGEIGGAGGSHGGVGITGLSGRYVDELKNVYFQSGSSVSAMTISGSAFSSDSGSTYGSVYQPVTWGSGGGSGDGPSDHGGAGGGSVRLNVTGTLTLYGASRISADGQSTDAVGGGGAGGSVWISCSSLVGSSVGNEVISATGGRGGNSTVCVQKGGMWGGAGGGGRVAIYCKSRSQYRGTIDARSGAASSTLWGSNGYNLGSIYLDSPLIASLTYTRKANTYYYVDLHLNVSRRGPVQIIETSGGGNGTRSSKASNDTAVVRGRWRVGYKASGYSDYLSSQATASELSSALTKLGTLGHISVDRHANSKNGWSWSVTFHSDITSPVNSLMYVDGQYLYSTAKNATIKVYASADPLASNVSSPLVLSNSTSVDAYVSFTGATLPQSNYTGRWIQPSILRLTVSNATASQQHPAAASLRGKLKAQLKVPITGYYGKYYTSPSTWSATLT